MPVVTLCHISATESDSEENLRGVHRDGFYSLLALLHSPAEKDEFTCNEEMLNSEYGQPPAALPRPISRLIVPKSRSY